MKNLFRNYYDKILVILAVVFMVAVVFVYIWGAGFLVENFNNATELKNANNNTAHFNIESAKNLGLSNQ